MNMMVRWTLLCVFALRQILTETSATNITNNIDIQPPTDVQMLSIDGNHFMNWSYPEYGGNGRVTFDVLAKDDWEYIWEMQCNQTMQKYCDIVYPIVSPHEECVRYSGEYNGKVRACMHLYSSNATMACSEWIEKSLEVPYEDQFSAPDFKIDGVYDGNELRLANRPKTLKHNNASLNCYHMEMLKYEITYWFENDRNRTIRTENVKFHKETISLPLPFLPKAPTKLCVRMGIIHNVYTLKNQWDTQCIKYTPSAAPEKRENTSTKYAIIGVCAGVALVILAILIRKCKQLYSKVYSANFSLPPDLNQLMNDVATGQVDIDGPMISECAHMISLDSADEKYISPVKIISTHDKPSLHTETEISLIYEASFDLIGRPSMMAHADSIPYVADPTTASFPIHNAESHQPNIDDDIARGRDEDPGRYLSAVCQLNKSPNISSSVVPLSIEELARARLLSSSMGDLSNHQSDFVLVERRSSSTNNILKSTLNEYCGASKTVKGQHPENVGTAPTEKLTVDLPPAPVQVKSHRGSSKGRTNDVLSKAVCLENPTYNPNPDLYDFLDEKIHCGSRPNSLNKLGQPLKGANPKKLSASLLHRRVNSYGKRFHSRKCPGNHFEGVKFFLPEDDGYHTRFCRTHARHISDCGASSSPKRTRNTSADSGYHVENCSVSDGSSLSPPVSPDDEKFYRDVFLIGDSPSEYVPCSDKCVHLVCKTFHDTTTRKDNSLPERLHSINSLQETGDSCEDESPYVTENSLKYIA